MPEQGVGRERGENTLQGQITNTWQGSGYALISHISAEKLQRLHFIIRWPTFDW